ncbi:hypothetical protein FB451DRAFT_1225999 [Mycena latifolia]|nr:hypothetical protein FB451DRAFT_1225999 [Mycena latifolia]
MRVHRMDHPSLVAVKMATVVLESFLYGLFVVLFSANLYLRRFKYVRPRGSTSRWRHGWRHPVVISTMAIFTTCTMHWIITVDCFFLAFKEDASTALQFYTDDSHITQVINSVLLELTVLIGDAVIIHRLWCIWNRDSRIIAVPILSWLGVLTCAIAVSYLFSQSSAENNKFVAPAGFWVTANWALTAVTNLYCTGFIAWRIWRTSRSTAEIGPGIMMPVLVLLVESAAIMTVWEVFFAAMYQTGNMLQFLATDLTPPIIGLTNTLIHLRMALGWSQAQAPETTVGLTRSASIAVDITVTNEYGLESISTAAPTSSKPGPPEYRRDC